jgi:hypothetical protein
VIKRTIGLRVSPEVEAAGIDLAYHGIESYPEFTNDDLIGEQTRDRGFATPDRSQFEPGAAD